MKFNYKKMAIVLSILLVITLSIGFVSAQWQESLNDDLLAYWDMTNTTNNTFIPDLQSENHLTLIGSITPGLTDAQVGNGQAGDYSGSNYWNTTDFSNLKSLNHSVSMFAWVMANVTEGSNPTIFSAGTGGGLELAISNTNLALLKRGISIDLTGSLTITNSTFYLVGLRLYPNRTADLWVNNVKDTSGAVSDSYQATGTLGIPGVGIYGVGNDIIFDEIGVWNRTLTDSEISALWNGGSGTPFNSTVTLKVTLNSPVNNTVSGDTTQSFNSTIQTTNGDLSNATLYVWYNNGTVFNNSVTNTISGSNISNSTIFNISGFSTGIYQWNVFGCTTSLCAFSTNNNTLDITTVTENSNTFNNSVIETSLQNFIINVTFNSTLYTSVSANLIYNGTSYIGTKVGTGDTINFQRSLTIPALNQSTAVNRSFYWSVLLNDAEGTTEFNTTTQQQTINPLVFTFCNETYASPVVINYTLQDEGDFSEVNGSMDASFLVSVLGGSITKNISFDSAVNNNTFTFCTNSNTTTYNVDSIIEVGATGYNGRTFYFNDVALTNATTFQSLLMLNSTSGTNIIIDVKDQGLQPLIGYFVDIERYYPDDNTYRLIHADRTDEFGSFVARLIEDDVKYRFTFKDSDNVVRKTTDVVSIACRSTFCTIPFVIEDVTDEFAHLDNLSNFEYSIVFDNSTNEVVYSWTDTTGDSSTHRLLVERVSINGTTVVCNITSTAPSSSMSCDVGGVITANYRVSAFRSASDETRIAVFNFEVGDPSDIFGLEGLMWGFLFLFILIAVGSFNPTVGVLLYLVGFVGLGVIGIISFSIPIFIANLVIGVLFIWAFKG